MANEAQKAWRQRNPEKSNVYAWRWKLKSQFGMTEEEYNYLVQLHLNQCGACWTAIPDPAGKRKKWCVDHDHKTGEVRGLLCHRCNMVLGKVQDDRKLLLALIRYLDYVPARHFRRWFKALKAVA